MCKLSLFPVLCLSCLLEKCLKWTTQNVPPVIWASKQDWIPSSLSKHQFHFKGTGCYLQLIRDKIKAILERAAPETGPHLLSESRVIMSQRSALCSIDRPHKTICAHLKGASYYHSSNPNWDVLRRKVKSGLGDCMANLLINMS